MKLTDEWMALQKFGDFDNDNIQNKGSAQYTYMCELAHHYIAYNIVTPSAY